MSVIRKKPFIEEVVDLLTISQKEALLSVMNTAGNNVPASLLNMPEKGIKPVLFKFDEANIKTGILIYLDGVPVTLIAYHRFQDVLLFRLYPNEDRYEKVNEYCDINELRRILGVGNEVTAGEIISGLTEKNKVLTADGEGGAFWDDKVNYLVLTGESGTLTAEQLAVAQLDSAVAQLGDNGKLYYKESQSNYYIVFSASPLVSGDTTYIEKITVNVTDRTWSYEAQAIAAGEGFNPEYDNTLSDASTNAVQNKVITEALEEKANVDGNYPTMTVGVADNLSPYDEESGIKQHAPFNFQASGTNNGSDATATVGSLAIMSEKRGNTVVVNQQLDKTNYFATKTENDVTFTNNGDGSITVSGTASADTAVTYYSNNELSLLSGHKYLVMGCPYGGSDSSYSQRVQYGGLLRGYDTGNGFIWEHTEDNTNVNGIAILIKNGTAMGSGKTFKPLCIDLTQWFNGDIPQDLLDNPDHFFRYYQGDLSYNEGTLVNSNGRYLKTIGRNQWDEQTLAGYYSDSNGAFVSDARYFCSKNPIRVVPNTTYNMLVFAGKQILFYDKDLNYISATGNSRFTTPANCCYIHFWVNSATYNNDITISIYYSGESGYDQYYPYEVLTNNDTGVEILRSAGSAADSKAPDGTITRRIGTYTFTGNESWTAGSNGYYSSVLQDNLAKSIGYSDKANVTSDAGLVATSRGNIVDGVITDGISVTDNLIYVSNNAGLAGKTIYYELAEPTPEQGTPYSENVAIDDFGSMDFSGTSGVPQGNNLFYPVDYKAYLDTLHKYTDGDPAKLALKSDLAVVDNKIGAKLPECPTTTDGTYVLKATVSDGAVIYNWVLEE